MPRLFQTAMQIINHASSDTALLNDMLREYGYKCRACGKLLACGAKCPKCHPEKVN